MLSCRVAAISMLLSLLVWSGCRGWTSDQPPLHPNPNMDTQLKYKAYRQSDFFADGRAMRPLVEGVVARGKLKEDDHLYQGKVNGQIAKNLPASMTPTKELVERGRDRYNVYCAPCHSQVGDGNGMVGRRLPVKPTTFHSDYMRQQPLGHYFDVITNGIRTMQPYKHQIPEADRWAIALYIQALQLSQSADGSWLSSSIR